MAPAADLQAAANDAYDDIFIYWQANSLKSRLTNFALAINSSGDFPDDDPNSRTIGDWLIPIQALADTIVGKGTLDQFNTAVQYVYRICWAADVMSQTTPPVITPAAAAVVLTQFNTYLA